MSPFCVTFRPTSALFSCSPVFGSTVASHITGAGRTPASLPVPGSRNDTERSAFARTFRPLAFSDIVTEPLASTALRSFSSRNCSKPVRVDSITMSVPVVTPG